MHGLNKPQLVIAIQVKYYYASLLIFLNKNNQVFLIQKVKQNGMLGTQKKVKYKNIFFFQRFCRD